MFIVKRSDYERMADAMEYELSEAIDLVGRTLPTDKRFYDNLGFLEWVAISLRDYTQYADIVDD